MSGGIARISSATQTDAAHPPDARTAKLRKAAGDFESLLVKQLLKESKLGGAEQSGGYGDMAVDALASAIEKGGGLGLSKHIEHAIHGGAPAHTGASGPMLANGSLTATLAGASAAAAASPPSASAPVPPTGAVSTAQRLKVSR